MESRLDASKLEAKKASLNLVDRTETLLHRLQLYTGYTVCTDGRTCGECRDDEEAFL